MIRTCVQASNPAVAAWDARLDRGRITCELSEDARDEALAFLREHPAAPGTNLRIGDTALPHLRAELETCRDRVERQERFLLLRPVPGLDVPQRRAFAWLVATLLGDPVVQNKEGDRFVSVWARPGETRVINGARYHQTREGGGPHTDNVSLPESWEYLVFSCVRPAKIGGDTILVSGVSIHQELLAVPAALEILQRPFWWEYRGIADGLFSAPIITYDDAGEPRFRYLRKYLESAHQRAGEPLTTEQVWALDCLEAIADLPRLQFRTPIDEGEILITHDSQVLHARTFFCDSSPGAPADASQAAAGNFRFFDRVWAKKR